MAPKARITLKDVAEKCGYSINTISRALRGDEHLPEDTQSRIRQAAMEVGYIRNNLASSLRSGRTGLIAILIEDLENQHYSSLLNHLSLYLGREGYHVMILPKHQDIKDPPGEKNAPQVVNYAISHGVDGVFLFPNRDDGETALALQRNHIPLVLIDREIDGMSLPVVRVDDVAGGALAARLLTEMGHERILYLAGPVTNGSQPLRERGFLDGLRSQEKQRGNKRESQRENEREREREKEKKVQRISHEDFMRALQEGSLRDLFFPLSYTGVFSFNDQLAYYLLNLLRNQGVRVPEEVSILGFDHIRQAFPYMAPLSTIGVSPGRNLAREAADLMLERMNNPEGEPQRIILPVEYMEGDTLVMAREV